MRATLRRIAWTTTIACLSITVWTQVIHAEEQEDEYYELMKVLVDSFEQIDRNYVKDVDRRELVEAAVRGMLAKLDPYSNYISPDDLAKFTESVEQEFGGVGIQVHFDREHRDIEVMTPFPGSPAYKAGIRAGDRIVEIEGKPVKEFPQDQELETAVKLLKGKPGVEVSVGIKHPGVEEIEQVKMTREIIQLDTVQGDRRKEDGSWVFMINEEQKIGYVRISHFTRRTGSELRRALRSLKDNGMEGLILDLRFNPGGLLQSAIEVCDLFIAEGKIVSTEGRNVPERVWSAKAFQTFKDFPMAVLVNRYSASASEIVSACLQDHDRAVIVGERTWGKGSVQNVVELEGGDSALKLTTASYHRPSGKNIHRFPNSKESDEWGVTPDDGYALKYSRDKWFDWQAYRQDRDVMGHSSDEPVEEFDDTHVKSAIEFIQDKLKGSNADDSNDSDTEAATADSTDPKPADESDSETEASNDQSRLPIEFYPLRLPIAG